MRGVKTDDSYEDGRFEASTNDDCYEDGDLKGLYPCDCVHC